MFDACTHAVAIVD